MQVLEKIPLELELLVLLENKQLMFPLLEELTWLFISLLKVAEIVLLNQLSLLLKLLLMKLLMLKKIMLKIHGLLEKKMKLKKLLKVIDEDIFFFYFSLEFFFFFLFFEIKKKRKTNIFFFLSYI